jgi:preprotein translocase subunit SecG
MLYNIIIGIYVLACVLLIIVILIQAGRGGGLVEGFSGAESRFGTKTNSFIVKLTAVLGALFLGSTILLAYLSKTRSKSLLENYKDTSVASSQEQTKLPSSNGVATIPETNPQSAQMPPDAKSASNDSKGAAVASTNQETGAQSTK